MKYLLVIALVALLLFLLYRRVRPYLKSLRQVIDVIREFQKGSAPAGRQAGAEKLVRCEACGIWIPASRALTSRAETVFCSTKCLESKK